MSCIADTVCRFIPLTWLGNELRGVCPDCGLRRLVVSPALQNWRCFGCGEHEFSGDSADGFVRFAEACGLTRGEPQDPIREPLRIGRWERAIPPIGSRPSWTLPWLGEALDAQELGNEQGERIGFRITYSKAGPMHWIYVLHQSDNQGCWKIQRPPLRERVAMRYPEVANEVAKYVQGRTRVTVAELLAGENPSGYRAKAIAFALAALGWVKKREGLPRRRRYYVPA